MNYKEILEKLKKLGTLSDFAHGEIGTWDPTYTSCKYDEIGTCLEVKSYGGEGKGESWWKIFHFPEHNVYIKVSGFYTSYDGVSFDGWDQDCREVKPVQKMVTLYEIV